MWVMQLWFLVQQLKNGLGNESRLILDFAASGRFMELESSKAYKVIEEMVIHDAQYGNPTSLANRVEDMIFLC